MTQATTPAVEDDLCDAVDEDERTSRLEDIKSAE
jgi:hypothetical protein